MNDKLDTTKDQRLELKRGAIMAPFVRSEGWETLKGILEKRMENEILTILEPATSQDLALFQNYSKGVLAGLRYVLELPDTMINVAAQARTELGISDEDEE